MMDNSSHNDLLHDGLSHNDYKRLSHNGLPHNDVSHKGLTHNDGQQFTQ